MAGGGHRSTLKQKNKSHNHGRHKSKRNLKREAHGKVNVKEVTKSKKLKARDLLRQEALGIHEGGRDETYGMKRNTALLPPRLVVVASLNKNIDVAAVVDLLKEADLSSVTQTSEQNILHVSAGKLKQRLSLVVPEYENLQALLDSAKAADMLLLLVSAEKGMDSYGEHCLTCLMGQGMPAHLFACQGLSNLTKKKLSDAKKRIDKQIEKSFPGDKYRSIDTWQDGQNLWRQISNQTLKTVQFRESRPYLLAEKFTFEPQPQDQTDSSNEVLECGTLKMSGYLRGKELNVNQLVHVPGWGDFQMSQIDQMDDPYPVVLKGNKDRRGSKKNVQDEEMKEASPTSTSFCLAKATNPDSLQSENIPDEMDQEQTWPNEDDYKSSQASGVPPPTVKEKHLKGVSDYQSNWILDDEDGDDESDEDEDENMDEEDAKSSGDEDEDEEEDNTASQAGEDDKYDEQMDMDEEKKEYERMKEEKLHVHFPDEVDTPLDTTARARFARYRGMDSFHTSAWDVNDSLPHEYARIDRVKKSQFKRLKKISMDDREDDGDNLPAEVGNFITVYVKNVPKSYVELHTSGQSLSLYGLFRNEQRMTLISTALMRMPNFKSPVKSKDPLIFQIGFRRFSSCPIFSEHAMQNKFKMERFLPANGFIVASMYAPLMFAPAPVLVFRENVMGKYDLVAKGSLEPLDTNRVVIKRVVLSGAPFKINKKSVVVRYMFFNREDIDFFKPVELRTKWGKRGHIKQALGTHGHMKCTFNGQLKSEDTVLMNLYKRVYPKWTYDPCVAILSPVIKQEEEENDEEDDMGVEEVKEGEAFKMFD